MAREEVPEGATFLPWQGEVGQVEEEAPAVEEEEEVVRRHYGLLDSPTAANWLVFLPPARPGSRANMVASCCPTLGTPRLTTTSTILPGDALTCTFAQLPTTLLLQLHQLPPLALLRLV